MHGNTCTTYGTHMEHTSTMHGIHQHHAWNMPVPCMEYTYASTTQGYACMMYEIRMFIMHEMFQFHVHSIHEMQALIHACT